MEDGEVTRQPPKPAQAPDEQSVAKANEAIAIRPKRGRLTLRTGMRQPDAASLTAAASLFDVALREARRVIQHWNENGIASTQPFMWSGTPGEDPF